MPLLGQVLENNPEKVKIVFKNFPLRNHKFAKKAAMAALVANRWGKFWEFHDQLFRYFDRLSDDKILEIAHGLGFDKAEFEEGMKDSKILSKIRQDIRDGKKAGVKGIPAIFINGLPLKKKDPEAFQLAIDNELEKLKKGDARLITDTKTKD